MSRPRDAATIILLRDGPRGLEVFMMKRHIRSDFVGGAYVFPGGSVDPSDHIEETLCLGLGDREASRVLGVRRGGLAFWVAAVRECFEESGILLACGETDALADFSRREVAARFVDYARRLREGRIPLEEIVRSEGLRLATDRVHYWAHWITPEQSPRRYDTRFFLALAPERQTAVHDGSELTASAWVTPREALAKAEKGEWTIIFPTLRNLMHLAEYETADEAEAAARARREVATIQPRIVSDEQGIRILVPGDPGYEEAGTPGEEDPLRGRGSP